VSGREVDPRDVGCVPSDLGGAGGGDRFGGDDPWEGFDGPITAQEFSMDSRFFFFSFRFVPVSFRGFWACEMKMENSCAGRGKTRNLFLAWPPSYLTAGIDSGKFF
jgi:hypothetical protein